MNPDYHGFWLFLYYWQTLIAGILAVAAAIGTIRATGYFADREIEAASKQTIAAQKQTKVTLLLERRRLANESRAFLTALKSAVGMILDNVAECRKRIPNPPSHDNLSLYQARQSLPCPLFQELRPACIRLGSDLTDSFLALDQYITAFAAAWVPATSTMGGGYRSGAATGFYDDLSQIETRAVALRSATEQQLEKCVAEIRRLDVELQTDDSL